MKNNSNTILKSLLFLIFFFGIQESIVEAAQDKVGKIKIKKHIEGKRLKGIQDISLVFLDWFENDSLKIYINNIEVFSDVVTTDEVLGYTHGYRTSKEECSDIQIKINNYQKTPIDIEEGFAYIRIIFEKDKKLIKVSYTNEKMNYR